MKNLQISFSTYYALFENSQIPSLLVSAESLQIIHANNEACKLYQYNLDELVNMNYNDLCTTNFFKEVIDFQNFVDHEHHLFNSIHQNKNLDEIPVEIFTNTVIIEDIKYYVLHVYQNKINYSIRNLLSDVFYNATNAIVIIDMLGKVITYNEKFTEIFGYSANQLVGKKLSEHVFPTDLSKNFDQIREGKIIHLDFERVSVNERLLNLNIIIIPHYLGNKVSGAQIIYQDIHEITSADEELNLFKEIIKATSDGVIIANKNREIIWVNKSYEKITGFTKTEVLTRNPNIVSSGLNSVEFYKMMWRTININGEWQGEIWNRKKDGTLYAQWLHIFVIKSKNGEVRNYIGIFKDLSEITSVNKKLLLLLEKDPLTAVHNRTYFFDKLSQSLLDKSSSGYILFLDIDGFKNLNARYGHQVGDLLLVEFAKRLLITFDNASIARYGGDEFVIHLTGDVTKGDLIAKLENFAVFLKSDIIVKNINFNITSSIGVSVYPQDSCNAEELIKFADLAMFHAKHDNLGFYFYNDLKDKK